MSFAGFINWLFKKPILRDWEKCRQCEYRLSVSNHSACYGCKRKSYGERKDSK